MHFESAFEWCHPLTNPELFIYYNIFIQDYMVHIELFYNRNLIKKREKRLNLHT